MYVIFRSEHTAHERGVLGDSSPNDQKGFSCVCVRTKGYTHLRETLSYSGEGHHSPLSNNR